MFTARFAPATFASEEFAVCRFRLLGQSPGWTETNDRLQTFSDLAAGDYVFEVQASADGVHWSRSTTRLSFRVLPAWWQRWWVQLGAVALFLAILRTGWTLRMKRHLRQEADLERQVAQRVLEIAEQQRHLEIEKASAQKAMRAASESDRRFRSLLEEVRLATLICDRDGQITFCNDFLLARTGWSRAEVLGRDWIETFVAPEQRDTLRAQFDKRGIEDAGPAYYECSIATRDGRIRVFQWNNTALRDEAGQIIGMASIGADVTDQRQMEEKNLQVQKMESIGRLAGGVAHDFNNLLTVINGYSRLALNSLNVDAPLRDSLEEIHNAGKRASGLTQQLLAFGRKQVMQPRLLDLNRVVGGMRSMLERLVGEDVELRFELHPGAVTTLADPHQLEQVLMNLVVNSRDAMPHGGSLIIGTSNVEIDASYVAAHPEASVGRYAVLAVTDSGVGMAEATRRRIFEPFFTTKEMGKGTGLGLSIIHGIVEQSGGFIEVSSEPGRGTDVQDLPAGSGGRGRRRHAGNRARAGRNRDRAGGGGPGGSGEVCGRRAEDIRLPGDPGGERRRSADGVPAGERVDRPGPHRRGDAELQRPGTGPPAEATPPGIKVLFMSGYTDDAIVHHGVLEAGMAFIEKPFSPEQLALKVREVLGAPRKPARILVADDETAVRRFLRAALEWGGYEVTEAADGKQALKEARKGQVDLVITDIVMPEQEGIETIPILRKEIPGIGIIALSGAFEGQFLKAARMLGADAVLGKPVSIELLLAKIAEVLASRR